MARVDHCHLYLWGKESRQGRKVNMSGAVHLNRVSDEGNCMTGTIAAPMQSAPRAKGTL